MYLETIDAKQLISNLFLVAYKLFLYKNRIKATIEAHKDDGSVAVMVGEVQKFGHYSRKAGRQQRMDYYQNIKNLNPHLMC